MEVCDGACIRRGVSEGEIEVLRGRERVRGRVRVRERERERAEGGMESID